MEQELQKVLLRIEEGFEDPISGELKIFISGNSKRIRSYIALCWLKALGTEIKNSIYDVLAVGELIHNASLLHDDVLDDANLRRNEITLNKKFGNKISILSGDYILSFIFEKLQNINNSKVTSLYGSCMTQMIKGEINQYFSRGKIPNFDEYIEICEKKTAELFRAIMESCLIITGVNCPNAIEFAKLFGIYFQIKNDLDEMSAKADRRNEIHTIIDIIGIEKTKALLDNYREEMSKKLAVLDDSVYKAKLGDLLIEL